MCGVACGVALARRRGGAARCGSAAARRAGRVAGAGRAGRDAVVGRCRYACGAGARAGCGAGYGGAGSTHARPLQYTAAAPRRHTRSPEPSDRHAALRRDHDSPHPVRRRHTRPDYALRKEPSLQTPPATGGRSTIHIGTYIELCHIIKVTLVNDSRSPVVESRGGDRARPDERS